MKVVESHDYKFPSHLLPALINNEPVIDSEDREGFDAFLDKLERYKKEYNATDYVVDYEPNSYYANSNCLYDLGCNVTEIQVHYLT